MATPQLATVNTSDNGLTREEKAVSDFLFELETPLRRLHAYMEALEYSIIQDADAQLHAELVESATRHTRLLVRQYEAMFKAD